MAKIVSLLRRLRTLLLSCFLGISDCVAPEKDILTTSEAFHAEVKKYYLICQEDTKPPAYMPDVPMDVFRCYNIPKSDFE